MLGCRPAPFRSPRSATSRSRWTERRVTGCRLRLAPDGGEPWLLLARQALGSIVVRELDESRTRHIAPPGLDSVVGAVAAAIPSFFVLAVRVRAKKDPARLERRAQLAQNARQLLRRDMKQSSVCKHAIEPACGQIQLEKVLLPHFAAGMIARHRREALDSINADRRMAQLGESSQVAAGPAAQVEDREWRLAFDRSQQGLDVLADIVIARAFPECVGAFLIVVERTGDDRGHCVGRKLGLHDVDLGYPQCPELTSAVPRQCTVMMRVAAPGRHRLAPDARTRHGAGDRPK